MDFHRLKLVRDFHNPECAILAFNLIMQMQQEGRTYSDILDYPGFLGLFTSEYLDGKSRSQLMIKLKNIVRDLRDYTGTIPPELYLAQKFFRARKKSLTPVSASSIEMMGAAISKIEKELGIDVKALMRSKNNEA